MKATLKKDILKMLTQKAKFGFPIYHLFSFRDLHKLIIETEESTEFKILTEEDVLLFLKSHPGANHIIFKEAGIKLPGWVTGKKAIIKDVLPHHVDELTTFLSHPFAPHYKAISEDEYLTLLTNEELNLMASVSRIFSY